MKLLSIFCRGNSPRSGLAFNPEQVGQMLHHIEERLQAVEQALADQRQEVAEGLCLGQRLQAQGDGHLWSRIETLAEEVEILRADSSSLEAAAR